MSNLNSCEFFCLLGELNSEKAIKWLEEEANRRLIVVLESTVATEPDPRITYHVLETPLQIPFLARKIAAETVLLPMQILGGTSEILMSFRKELQRAQHSANLLLSDAADFGCSLVKQCVSKRRPLYQGLHLKNAFQKIPAIVVGAGSSLQRIQHLLPRFQDEALILAGGSALNLLKIEPHFAASIDKEAPYQKFKQYPFSETPFFIQNRMSALNFSLIHGEAILFPDSHFSFLNEEEPFDGGWTVGTFLVAIAAHMGCDPILLAGMDLCYDGEGRKYGEQMFSLDGKDNLISVQSIEGKELFTQPDWFMAHHWLEMFAREHPETQFIDVTGEGIGFSLPIRTEKLDSFRFVTQSDLRKQVHETVQALHFAPRIQWEKWKESLKNCQGVFKEEELKKEIVYEKLLLPLWNVWSSVFERTFGVLDLDMHRLVFFQNVIEEHLHVFE